MDYSFKKREEWFEDKTSDEIEAPASTFARVNYLEGDAQIAVQVKDTNF